MAIDTEGIALGCAFEVFCDDPVIVALFTAVLQYSSCVHVAALRAALSDSVSDAEFLFFDF
jgi:hypothetical protein